MNLEEFVSDYMALDGVYWPKRKNAQDRLLTDIAEAYLERTVEHSISDAELNEAVEKLKPQIAYYIE